MKILLLIVLLTGCKNDIDIYSYGVPDNSLTIVLLAVGVISLMIFNQTTKGENMLISKIKAGQILLLKARIIPASTTDDSFHQDFLVRVFEVDKDGIVSVSIIGGIIRAVLIHCKPEDLKPVD